MADSQDVLNAPLSSTGWTNYDNPTAWGSKPETPISDLYQGGYHNDGTSIPAINDPAAYKAALQQQAQTSGRALDVARYQQMAQAAMAQQAPKANYGNAQFYLTQGGAALQSANDARQSQLGALALQQQAAQGSAPSQAQMLGQSMIGQSLQAQQAGAASARGGAMAQAAAYRNASQQAASTQAQGTQQTDAMRAQEMATARGAYSQGASDLRSSDYAGSQAANGLAQTGAQMGQFNAQMQAQQNALNNSANQYYEGMGFNVNQASLNAALGQSSQLRQQNQFDQQMDFAQSQQTAQEISAGLGAGATAGASALTHRASGGPIQAGQPVLVGEQGPELIVPAANGDVLPATHPASQAAAKQTMTMADVAKLRQQADDIERGLRRQIAAGPSVHAQQQRQPMSLAQAAQLSAQTDAQMGGMRGSVASGPAVRPQLGELAAAQPYLMGGRENPYGQPMSYAPSQQSLTSVKPATGIVRDDPYAMANAAGMR